MANETHWRMYRRADGMGHTLVDRRTIEGCEYPDEAGNIAIIAFKSGFRCRVLLPEKDDFETWIERRSDNKREFKVAENPHSEKTQHACIDREMIGGLVEVDPTWTAVYFSCGTPMYVDAPYSDVRDWYMEK